MKKKTGLSQLLEYAGRHKYLTYMSWLLSAASALIALVPFYFIWRIMKDILSDTEGCIVGWGIYAVLAAFVSMLLYVVALCCSHLSAFRIASNLRKRVISHIASLPIGIIESEGSGKLRKTVNDASGSAETYLAHQLPDKAGAIVTPIGLLALLLIFDAKLGLLSLAPVILGFGIMAMMTGRKMQEKVNEYQNSLDNMSNEAVEYVRGIPVVKTFGQTVFSFRRFKQSIDDYSKWTISYTKDLRIPMICYTTAINGVFAFLVLGAALFTKNGVTISFLLDFMFYIMITPVISLTLTKIMYMSENEMIVDDALSRINAILEYPPLSEAENKRVINDYSIELENVVYSYNNNKNNKNALDGISLKIEQGKTVAFVGPSGGGKSTLAALITRFFDPQSGCVKIGGTDIRDIPKKELMNTISFVFQNSRLIKGSILENVLLGRPDATKEEVMSALKNAQCDDIIEKLPNGIDTVIGSGIYLSGGEQQRIAIARAILKNSPILIFDEATAFADPDNEVRVQNAITNLAKGKTVIMIAHRLTAVKNADVIYVINNGKITESGKINELMENKGLFEKMWNDYQTAVEWRVV
ncbi:MAG: ABC transporter ATP-binding protein [Firmicutes bacterium]|nr:ABC transporter ATP-binding protein [Bacillota bacterium]